MDDLAQDAVAVSVQGGTLFAVLGFRAGALFRVSPIGAESGVARWLERGGVLWFFGIHSVQTVIRLQPQLPPATQVSDWNKTKNFLKKTVNDVDGCTELTRLSDQNPGLGD